MEKIDTNKKPIDQSLQLEKESIQNGIICHMICTNDTTKSFNVIVKYNELQSLTLLEFFDRASKSLEELHKTNFSKLEIGHTQLKRKNFEEYANQKIEKLINLIKECQFECQTDTNDDIKVTIKYKEQKIQYSLKPLENCEDVLSISCYFFKTLIPDNCYLSFEDKGYSPNTTVDEIMEKCGNLSGETFKIDSNCTVETTGLIVADPTQPAKSYSFSKNAPKYRTVYSGCNIECKCRNIDCKSFKEGTNVMVPMITPEKKMIKQIDYFKYKAILEQQPKAKNKNESEIKCPSCGKYGTLDIAGYGFQSCYYQILYTEIGSDQSISSSKPDTFRRTKHSKNKEGFDIYLNSSGTKLVSQMTIYVEELNSAVCCQFCHQSLSSLSTSSSDLDKNDALMYHQECLSKKNSAKKNLQLYF